MGGSENSKVGMENECCGAYCLTNLPVAAWSQTQIKMTR